jgi:hypothetical protein
MRSSRKPTFKYFILLDNYKAGGRSENVTREEG